MPEPYLRHPISGRVHLVPLPQLMTHFSTEQQRSIQRILMRRDVIGMMLYECLDLDGPEAGTRAAVPVGPGCQHLTPEAAAQDRLTVGNVHQYPTRCFLKEFPCPLNL